MEILRKRLYELRKDMGISLPNLAVKLGTTYQTLGKWEEGVHIPNAEWVAKLASFYNVSSDYLLGLVDD